MACRNQSASAIGPKAQPAGPAVIHAADVRMIKEKEGSHMLSTSIKKLITYGLESGLLPANEVYYATNLLLDCFHEEYYEETEETF